MSQPHSNRLAKEASPYLQQHAHNPVDWYPWGEEALALARAEDRPILLSIGYSACHWCHVMAHECFEDEAIAAQMNAGFVNIKVDREARPDLDHVYQLVCQLLTQQGGWPLTVFLTPAHEPFYVGTYFPPRPMYGRPGFPEVLHALAEAYRTQRDKVAEQARVLVAALGQTQEAPAADGASPDPLAAAWHVLSRQVDGTHGGFGAAPKFPNPFCLALALRFGLRHGDPEALEVVHHACRAMQAGGIHDQLGGGFHRYSVDAAWSIPHFEKMLYDNALLAPIYVDAGRACGDAELIDTARDTLDWLLADLRAPEGGFYSATDADSEGEEGRYFVWTPDEIATTLPAEDAALFRARYGVEADGNFEGGTTCLYRAADLDTLAVRFGGDAASLGARLADSRARLLAVRARRVPPLRDEKILATWNGLALSALARCGLLLREPRYLAATVATADFLLDTLLHGSRLKRFSKDGEGHGEGFLDDYANVAAGLLEAFCAVGEPRYFVGAVMLAETVLAHFADAAVGDFFLTPDDGEELVLRPKDLHDGATPSGVSAFAHALLTLSRLSGESRWSAALERLLAAHAGSLTANPWGLANLILATDGARQESESVVVVGAGEEADALLAVALDAGHPHRLVRRCPAGSDPLLPARGLLEGHAAAYVCRGQVCLPPVRYPARLAAKLSESAGA